MVFCLIIHLIALADLMSDLFVESQFEVGMASVYFLSVFDLVVYLFCIFVSYPRAVSSIVSSSW